MACRRLFFLVVFCSVATSLFAQSYKQVNEQLDQSNDDVQSQLAYLEKILMLPHWEKYGDTLAMLYYQQSRLLFRGGVSIEQSIKALENGLENLDETEHRDLWIKLWYYKGYWYRKWDKYEEAKQALTYALKYTTDNPYQWDATIQLGKTFKDRGEFSVALELYDKAINLAGEDPDRLSTSYEVISFVYLIMETEEGALKALPWLDKLLDLISTMEGQGHFKASMTYNKGCAYLTLGDFKNASYYFNLSEEMMTSCCDDDSFISLLYESRAELLVEQGNYKRAIDFYRKSISLYEHSFDLTRSDGLSTTYRKMGEAYYKMSELKPALDFVNKALSYRLAGIDNDEEINEVNTTILQSNGEKHYLIEELLLKANVLIDLNVNTSSLSYLQEGSNTLEYADIVVDYMRFEHIEESTKEFWREKTSEVYSLLIKVNYLLDDKEAAFNYAEKSKYLLMGEHLVRKQIDVSLQSLSEDLSSQLYKTRSKIDSIKIHINKQSKNVDQNEANLLTNALVDLRKKEDDLLSTIKEKDPNFYQDNFSFQLASIKDIRESLLTDQQVLVEYYLDEEELYTFVISREIFEVRQIDLPFSVMEKLEEMRAAISHEARNAPKYLQQYASTANDIYKITFDQIDELLSDDLIIVADGILSLIPFSILLTESIDIERSNPRLNTWPYLMNKYRLSYLKSASLGLLQLNQKRQQSFDEPILALNPSFGQSANSLLSVDDDDAIRGNLQPLYGSEEEIEFIQGYLAGDFLLKEEASESNFKKALSKSYSIFHLASHAIVDDERPEYTKLILTEEDEEEDGYLHLYEIANLPIHSDLIVLSACNTGYGQIQEGEGVNSLGKSFAKAGSPNLLMSLWPVSDRATSTLIKEYYKQLLSGVSKRDAITDAKKSFLASVPAAYHHPFYWGGFVYYGDNEPLQMAKIYSAAHWYIIGIAGLILLISYRKFI